MRKSINVMEHFVGGNKYVNYQGQILDSKDLHHIIIVHFKVQIVYVLYGCFIFAVFMNAILLFTANYFFYCTCDAVGNNFTQFSLIQRPNRTNSYVDLVDPDGPTVQFVLFTRKHPPTNLKLGDLSSFQQSGFRTTRPTKIIIHGFLSSIQTDVFVVNKNVVIMSLLTIAINIYNHDKNVMNLSIYQTYLDSGDYNVIGMDWSILCEFEYLSAISGMKQAGNVLAEFIKWLSQIGVSLNGIHLIGHSLGAHVAAIAGHKIQNDKIGLDPAAPGFRDFQPPLRLDSDDAKLVDVIHTNVKVLSLIEPLGHIDFYPNGGKWQPGCPVIYDVWKIPESLICNHARAYYYFAESVRNKRAFRSKKCKTLDEALNETCSELSRVFMGQPETYKRGIYYLRTRATRPFTLPNV